MRIKKIRLKNGSELETGKLTILVGPNNVGKSRTLRDIQAKVVAPLSATSVLVDKVFIEKPTTFQSFLESLGVESFQDPQNVNQLLLRGRGPNVEGVHNAAAHIDFPIKFDSAPEISAEMLSTLGHFCISFMDASSRLSASQAAPSFNPHMTAPANFLQTIFKAGLETENKLSSAFRNTFGMDIKLDYSGMQQFTFRIARKFSDIPEDPRDAYPVLAQYQQLDEQGDGYRSFVGVVLSALLARGRVILLDEPEAFLHPAQAKTLGHWLATHFKSTDSQMIVATHNASFLSGIVSAGNDVDLFRLNRIGDSTIFTRIEPSTLAELACSPVLSSQRVLESIFFRGVAVCEADADRAIYESVARIIGLREILFVHAHNKQTIKTVVKLLKAATIPAVAVADIDLLNSAADLIGLAKVLNPETDETEIKAKRQIIAEAIHRRSDYEVINEIKDSIDQLLQQLKEEQHTLSGLKGAINRINREASKWAEIKRNGVNALDSREKEIAEQLLAQLAKDGLFVVPVGELESWVNVGTLQKNKWIVKALEMIARGDCPPDLKEFVERIGRFLGETAAE